MKKIIKLIERETGGKVSDQINHPFTRLDRGFLAYIEEWPNETHRKRRIALFNANGSLIWSIGSNKDEDFQLKYAAKKSSPELSEYNLEKHVPLILALNHNL